MALGHLGCLGAAPPFLRGERLQLLLQPAKLLGLRLFHRRRAGAFLLRLDDLGVEVRQPCGLFLQAPGDVPVPV